MHRHTTVLTLFACWLLLRGQAQASSRHGPIAARLRMSTGAGAAATPPPSATATATTSTTAATSKKPYYVTTPIYYVNDKPHIGHAYTALACDVIARFMRLVGREVMFLTGTDEHGQKVQASALKAGRSPQQFCDEVSQEFRRAYMKTYITLPAQGTSM